MASTTTFVPAANVTVMPAEIASAGPMPAVDGANQDTQIVATGGVAAWVAFGAGAGVGPGAPGTIKVIPGFPVLLTNNAATLAACSTNPNVIGGAPAIAAAGATSISYMAMQRGGSVTITRGTASALNSF